MDKKYYKNTISDLREFKPKVEEDWNKANNLAAIKRHLDISEKRTSRQHRRTPFPHVLLIAEMHSAWIDLKGEQLGGRELSTEIELTMPFPPRLFKRNAS